MFMLKLPFAAILAPLVFQVVRTSPVADPSVDVGPSAFPAATLDLVAATHGVVHNSDTSELAGLPATLYVCSDLNCANCTFINIPGIQPGLCDGQGSFNSLHITYGFTSPPFPYTVLVGPSCSSFAQVPGVNTCYSIQGGPWHNYEIFDN